MSDISPVATEMRTELHSDNTVTNKSHKFDRNDALCTTKSNMDGEFDKEITDVGELNGLEKQLSEASLQYKNDCEVLGYLTYNDITSSLDSDYIEVEWPALYWKTFTQFPNLALELRRKIWFYALPGPRLLRLGNKKESVRPGSPKDEVINSIELIYSGISCGNKREILPIQLLSVCRESHDIFREHYKRIGIQDLPEGKFISQHNDNKSNIRFQCNGYIDPKLDTLVYDSQAKTSWENFQVKLDFSIVTDVAVAGYALHGSIDENLWRLLESTFPRLKNLRVIANHSDNATSAHGDDPFKFGELLSVDHHLIIQIQEAIWSNQNHPPLFNQRTNRLQRNIIRHGDMHNLVHQAEEYTASFRGQVEANPNYWSRVQFLPCLLRTWGIHFHCMALKGKSTNQENKIFFSRVPLANEGTGRIKYRNRFYRYLCNTDGSFFDRYVGIKELFDGYEPVEESKFLRWPWTYELPNNGNIIWKS